jgi:hypothetical protein
VRPYYEDPAVTIFNGDCRYCEIAARRMQQDVLALEEIPAHLTPEGTGVRV